MGKWYENLSEKWNGEDAFIVGGGPSLKGFDFSILEGKNNIGCNHAFRLGASVCPVLYFTDNQFWYGYKDEILSSYRGEVFSAAPQLHSEPETSLKWFSRERDGLKNRKNVIGWNFSTGASAINLALRFGAKRIFLLGIDLKLSSDGNMNWHPLGRRYSKDPRTVFHKFKRGFERTAFDLPNVFPGREVILVSDHPSIDCFPSMGVREFKEMIDPPSQRTVWAEMAKEDAANGAFE